MIPLSGGFPNPGTYLHMGLHLLHRISPFIHMVSYFYPNLATFPFSKMSVETKDGKTISLEGNQLKSALQYLPTQVSTFCFIFYVIK